MRLPIKFSSLVPLPALRGGARGGDRAFGACGKTPLPTPPRKAGRGEEKKQISFLNLLCVLCFIGATLMLGKSSWIMLKAEVAQVLLHKAFTQSIATGEKVKAWSWADTYPVAEVRVPRINASAIVLEGATPEALAFGPAHLSDTPDVGEKGTVVFAAHRDTHFRFLQNVRAGDVVDVTRNDGLTFQYQITTTRVAEYNQSGIERHASGHHLVLSTCWPFDAITHGTARYIVEAEMVR
jgi:sortase A